MRVATFLGFVVLAGTAFPVFSVAQVCTLTPSNIVSWWTGDGTTNDIIGTNNGTLQGGAGYAPSQVGQSFSLNGVGGFVDVPYSPTLDMSGSFSIDTWIKANSLPGSLVTKENTSNQSNYNLHAFPELFFAVNFNAPATFLSGTSGSGCEVTNNCWVVGATNVTTGVFHHVAAVYDDNAKTLNVYLDGTLDGTATFTTTGHPNPVATDVFIGKRNFNNSPPSFNGLIGQFQLFGRALTPTEVGSLACAELDPFAQLNGGNTFSGNQTVNGTLAATNFVGNGAGLTSISPANISPGTASINITGNAATATSAANANALGGVAAANYARLDVGNHFTGDQNVAGNQSATGNLNAGGSSTLAGPVTIGGGTPIIEHLSLTPSITVPPIAPNNCAVLSVSFPGATDGDTIALGVKDAFTSNGSLNYFGWVSAGDTVKIKVCDLKGATNRSLSGTIRVDIWKH